MNILLISPLPPPSGGIATWTQEYLSSQECLLNNVTLINTAIKGNRIKNISKRNIFEELKRFITSKRELNLKIKENNIELIHYNSSCTFFGLLKDFLMLMAINSNIKIIYSCHCDTKDMVKGKIHTFVFKKVLKKADHIFCLNQSSMNHIQAVSNVQRSLVPNFINTNSKIKELIKVNNELKTVTYVGHVKKTKGINDLIAIAKLFPKLKFQVVGPNVEGFDFSKIRNIVYYGELANEDVLEILKSKTDLFLFLSHSEGFPMAVLEAMSMGIPILASNVGAISDMIENKGGIVVPLNNVKEVENSLRVLKTPEVRNTMSEWNYLKVKNYYEKEIVMRKIFNKYKELLK